MTIEVDAAVYSSLYAIGLSTWCQPPTVEAILQREAERSRKPWRRLTDREYLEEMDRKERESWALDEHHSGYPEECGPHDCSFGDLCPHYGDGFLE